MSASNKPQQANIQDSPPCITSELLFGSNRQLKIQHEGETYTLRITSRDKLILTK